MAKSTKTTTAASSTARSLDNRRSLKGAGQKESGPLVIVGGKALHEEGRSGLVASGIYEKSEPDKYNAANKNYFVRNVETDTLYIIRSCDSIAKQFGQLEGLEGASVEVIYNGMGNNKKTGRDYHDFEVFVVND